MLSIIVISNRQKLFEQLCVNIKNTVIGAYEVIHQKEIEKGIACAYNNGAEKAQYNYLCFVHDDVLFHTKGWDEKLIEHLQDEKTGVIGVMGGRYKSAFGVSWNDGPVEMHRYNALNGANGGNHLFYNPSGVNKDEVICLDGAFLCTSKKTWQQHPFDEQTFGGFHFYDLDICLQAYHGGKKNYIIYDVLIEHFSGGKMDAIFLKEYLLFSEKWKSSLPVFIGNLSKKQISNFEGYALTKTIQLIKKNRLPGKYSTTLIKKYFASHKNIYQLLRAAYFILIK